MKLTLYQDQAVYRNNSGLGNFLHTTPSLQYIAQKRKKPIRVYTSLEYLKEALRDAPFIDWVGKDLPKGSDFVYEPEYDRTCHLWDYQFSWKNLTGRPWSDYNDQFYPYIDRPQLDSPPKKNFVILLNGGAGGNSAFSASKKMTPQMLSSIFTHVQALGMDLIFCGTEVDYEITNKIHPDTSKYCKPCLGNIREVLGLINLASGVIANDTGLYHAACAMKKRVLVSTRVPVRSNGRPSVCIRNLNPHTEFVEEYNWDATTQAFLKRLKNKK